MARRPLIGVTGPDRKGGPAWRFTQLAVWRAGGRALRITPARPASAADVDGLVIGGGADIDPARYGAEPLEGRPALRRKTTADLLISIFRRDLNASDQAPWLDRARDRLEFDLVEQAMARGIPLLGICRGAQLLAVAHGGSLHQDVVPFYSFPPYVRSTLPRKRVYIEHRARLRRSLRTDTCLVNTLHRQAIRTPGEGLRVVATETNGLIQSVEAVGSRFVVGVQWHPEYMPQVARQLRLFRALVAAAGRAHAPT